MTLQPSHQLATIACDGLNLLRVGKAARGLVNGRAQRLLGPHDLLVGGVDHTA
jgi:hypothetical protein